MQPERMAGRSLSEIWKLAYRLRRAKEDEMIPGVYYALKAGEPGPGNRCVLERCYPLKNDVERNHRPGWRWVYRGEVRPVTVDVVSVEISKSGQTVLVVKAVDLRTGKKRN